MTTKTEADPNQPLPVNGEDPAFQAGMSGLTADELSAAGLDPADFKDVLPVANDPAPAAGGAANAAAPDASELTPPQQPATPNPAESLPAPQQQQQVQQPGQQSTEPHMIPKGRFDEVLEQNKQLQEQLTKQQEHASQLDRTLAYQAGLLKQAEQQQQPQGPTLQDQMAAIDTKLGDLRKQYDQGEIDAATYVSQTGALQRDFGDLQGKVVMSQVEQRLQQQTIQQQSQQPQQQPQPQQPQGPEAYVVAQQEKVFNEHPYLQLIPAEHASTLHHAALAEAQRQGIQVNYRFNDQGQIEALDNPSLLKLTQLSGIVADRLGHALTGLTPEQARAQVNGANQPQPGPQPAPTTPTAPTAAQPSPNALQDKLNLQNTMPPDVTQAGQAAPAVGLTEAQIIKISETNPNALENLPDKALEGFLN